MRNNFSVTGIHTGLIRPGDDMVRAILDAKETADLGGLKEGDIIVIAESALATSESRLIRLADIVPSDRATDLGSRYGMDPREVQVVINESDSIVGGIPGFLLCMKKGTLLPNAGVDASNAPPGYLCPLPEEPDRSARHIRDEIRRRKGILTGVIVADSRTHAMRVGCSGVAIGCAGIPSVIDDRGRSDLFGRKLVVTKRAVADNIATAAELVMGEADECTPVAVIRGLGLPMTEQSGIEEIAAEDCLFMGTLRNIAKDD
ncbi:MAG TPA: coenzyme F420-0:L-glutamate ligase [Methanoregulaceae archaeon]|nr:coenzyme F420-0:L-glutamate ligase [Methanoregulaceae archaeon]